MIRPKKLNANLLAAEWSLHLLSPETLVDLAVQALVEGYDGKALVELAGLTNPCREPYEVLQKLAIPAIRELGAAIPSTADAAILLTSRVCSQIVSGQLDAVEGAIWIQNHVHYRTTGFKWLIPFVGPASECEGRTDLHNFYRPRILKAAQDFLSQHAL